MSGEKGARFVFGILGSRRVVFEPMTVNPAAGLQHADVKPVVGAGIDDQIDGGALTVRLTRKRAAGFRRIRIVSGTD